MPRHLHLMILLFDEIVLTIILIFKAHFIRLPVYISWLLNSLLF